MDETPEYRLKRLAEATALKERETRILSDPELMNVIYEHLASGGSLSDLAKLFNIGYGKLSRFVFDIPANMDRYKTAMEAYSEYHRDRVEQHMSDIAQQDIRELYDSDGKLKPMGAWPDSVARAVASIKPTEWGVEVKLHDKIKALHLHGKEHGKYVDKHEVTGTLKLDEIIGESFKKPTE